MALLALLFALTFPATAPAQEPAADAAAWDPQIAATWNGGSIGLDRFDRFLAATHRGKASGNEAVHHILQLRIVEWEAERRKLRVPDAAIAARIEDARKQVEDQGYDFDQILAKRGLDSPAFERLMRASFLHEMLVLEDRPGGGDAPVSAEELIGWTERRIADLKTKAVAPGAGIVFESEGFRITDLELGQTLRQALAPARLEDNLRQLALQDILAAWSAQKGIPVTEQVLEDELDWRRKRVAENPAFAGATFEGLLTAQGSSLEAVRHGPELRTAGLLRILSKDRYPDSWFDELTEEARDGYELQFGESRQVAWLLLRSVESSPDPLDLSHEDARAELARYAAEMQSPDDFFAAAEKYSEHESSRVRRGMLGWVHRTEPGIDPAVSTAAFAAPSGEIVGPIATREGQALVLVMEIRAQPPEAEFRAEVRRSFHAALRKEILAEAGLRTVYQEDGAGTVSR